MSPSFPAPLRALFACAVAATAWMLFAPAVPAQTSTPPQEPRSEPPPAVPLPSNVPQSATPAPTGDTTRTPGEPSTAILDALTPASREVAVKRAKWVFDMPDGTVVDYWPLAMSQDFGRRFVRFDPPPTPKKGQPAPATIGGPEEVIRVSETPETIVLGWADGRREQLPWSVPKLPNVVAWRDGAEVRGGRDYKHLYCADPLLRPQGEPVAQVVGEVAPGISSVRIKSREPWKLSTEGGTISVRLDPAQVQGKRVKLKEFFVYESESSVTIGGTTYSPFRLVDADAYRMTPARLVEAVRDGRLKLVDWKFKKVGKGNASTDFQLVPEYVELRFREKPPTAEP